MGHCLLSEWEEFSEWLLDAAKSIDLRAVRHFGLATVRNCNDGSMRQMWLTAYFPQPPDLRQIDVQRLISDRSFEVKVRLLEPNCKAAREASRKQGQRVVSRSSSKGTPAIGNCDEGLHKFMFQPGYMGII